MRRVLSENLPRIWARGHGRRDSAGLAETAIGFSVERKPVSVAGRLSIIRFLHKTAPDEAIAEHMKSFAFGDGEEITSLAGERTWISVSGFKGDRLFYRQAALACGGDRWHQIAFEYPVNEKRGRHDFIRRAVEELKSGTNEGCDRPLSKPAEEGKPHSAEQSSHAQ